MTNSTNETPQYHVERFRPDPAFGLTEAQASQRARQGLSNRSEASRTKPVSQIVRENVVTFFNILNFIFAGLILSVGSYKNLMFMGLIISNTAIGIIQEIRAKKVIDSLSLITAAKAAVIRSGQKKDLPVEAIVLDDVIELNAGNQIPADCVLLDGQCEADESLLTGESDAVPKSPGDPLLSGSFLVSGRCRARVDHVGKDNYASKIAASAKYYKRPNSEIMTWTDRIVRFTAYSIIPIGAALFCKQFFILKSTYRHAVVSSVAALISMIPEGLVLLTSIVFAVGVIRLARHKALVQELSAIETLAHVDTLCLDKTGTLTEGSMQMDELVPLNGADSGSVQTALAALSSSLDDGTPTMNAVKAAYPNPPLWKCGGKVAFSSARKWSGASFGENGSYVLGAGEFILGSRYAEIQPLEAQYAAEGKRVLLLAKVHTLSPDGSDPDAAPLALLLLSDKIRKSARKTLDYFRSQGVDLKVISGDNPVAVASIAKKAGLKKADAFIDASSLKSPEELRAAASKYSVFGRVTPKQKLELVKALKEKGHTVAMTGDGVNDVPALKESDCSIAMASGSDAARSISNIVLLDSDFASMPRIVAEGRRSINNLQRSATLYLVKAVFAALTAVLFIFIRCSYPFQPIQFTLINAVAIGIPSFFLALEPNRELIRGRFIENVMKQSLPGAITLTINLAVLTSISLFFTFSTQEISTLAVLLTAFTELHVLYDVCKPFNTQHRVLFSTMSALFLAALLIFPKLFEVVPLTLPMIFVLVPLLVLAACLMPVLTHFFAKIIFRNSRG